MLAVLLWSVLKRLLASCQYAVLPQTNGKPPNYYDIITRRRDPLSTGTAEQVDELRRQVSSAQLLQSGSSLG